MANYRKSFNFRNGVQVDDDNFIVNANGLVGIGTSSPTEFLDVRGNAKVVGLVTATNFYAGVATVGFMTATQGLSVSGVLTATTFSGSASGLTGIYAIAVDGWHITASGVSTTSNVGVGTTNPQGTFQVGTAVTIYSTGNATYTGIITSPTFSGNLSGNVTGNVTGNVNSSGVSTFTTLKVGTSITAASGILSATTFVGNLTGDVTGNVTGNATGLSGTPNINVGVVTSTNLLSSNSLISGISTVTTELNVGTGGTAITALNTGRLGIGTAEPSSELQIRKASGSLLEVVSDSGQARVSIGQSVGVGNSTGVLRFGNATNTLDVLNNDIGDIRNIIHAGTGAGSTGNFKWIYGQTNAERMTLTYDGKLGLNQPTPVNTLHVVGTSTVTGNAWVGGNLNVAGNITGTISYPSLISGTNLYNTSGITTLSQLKVTNSVDFDGTSFVGLGTRIGIGTNVSQVDPSNSVDYGLTVENGLYVNKLVTQDSINVGSGIVTAANVRATLGFRSGVGTEFIKIDFASSPNRIIFTVAGIGSTSLQLF